MRRERGEVHDSADTDCEGRGAVARRNRGARGRTVQRTVPAGQRRPTGGFRHRDAVRAGDLRGGGEGERGDPGRVPARRRSFLRSGSWAPDTYGGGRILTRAPLAAELSQMPP